MYSNVSPYQAANDIFFYAIINDKRYEVTSVDLSAGTYVSDPLQGKTLYDRGGKIEIPFSPGETDVKVGYQIQVWVSVNGRALPRFTGYVAKTETPFFARTMSIELEDRLYRSINSKLTVRQHFAVPTFPADMSRIVDRLGWAPCGPIYRHTVAATGDVYYQGAPAGSRTSTDYGATAYRIQQSPDGLLMNNVPMSMAVTPRDTEFIGRMYIFASFVGTQYRTQAQEVEVHTQNDGILRVNYNPDTRQVTVRSAKGLHAQGKVPAYPSSVPSDHPIRVTVEILNSNTFIRAGFDYQTIGQGSVGLANQHVSYFVSKFCLGAQLITKVGALPDYERAYLNQEHVRFFLNPRVDSTKVPSDMNEVPQSMRELTDVSLYDVVESLRDTGLSCYVDEAGALTIFRIDISQPMWPVVWDIPADVILSGSVEGYVPPKGLGVEASFYRTQGESSRSAPTVTVWSGSQKSDLTADNYQEDHISVPSDEDWFDVNLNGHRYTWGNGERFMREYTWYGLTAIQDGVSDVNQERASNGYSGQLSRVTDRYYISRMSITPVNGWTYHMRTPRGNTKLAVGMRGVNLPLVRAKARTKYIRDSYSYPAGADPYTVISLQYSENVPARDASVLTQNVYNRVKSATVRSITLDLVYSPQLQLLDRLSVTDPNTGTTFSFTVSSISEGWEAGEAPTTRITGHLVDVA